jgi:hypothetical protein
MAPRTSLDGCDDRPAVVKLFANLREALPELRSLLERCNADWVYEDGIYRFYHQSLKVYGLQQTTEVIVAALRGLAPDPESELNAAFLQVVRDGTGKVFTGADNQRWLEVTRPILEAFFHARFFLEMAVRYGAELDEPPRALPSGWAAFLYLYDLR